MKRIACLVFVAAVVSGCGGGSPESSEATAPAPETVRPASNDTQASRLSPGAAGMAQTAVKAVEDTAAKAQLAAEEVSAKAQALLDQARTLLDEKKIVDAGQVLNQLGGMTLDAEQQKVLADLKEEVAKVAVEVGDGLSELKTLVAEKNYNEATATIAKLADYQLTPEQQRLMDDLKGQVKQLLGNGIGQEGAKAVQDLLRR